MKLTSKTARRTAAAAIACTAILAPAAALASAGSPAGAASPASTPRCPTSGLVVWMDTQGNPGAGQDWFTLQFTNLSGHACTLHGFPGVSAVDLGGHRIGSPAEWGSPKLPAVRLASGATATAMLDIENVSIVDPAACHPVTAAGLRVYPPYQTAYKVVPFPFRACSRTGQAYMAVEPVQKQK